METDTDLIITEPLGSPRGSSGRIARVGWDIGGAHRES